MLQKSFQCFEPWIRLDSDLYDITHHTLSSGSFPMHSHDNCVEIIFIIQGKAIHIINNNHNPISRGDVFFISPGELHGFSECSDLELYNISCSIEILRIFEIDVTFWYNLKQHLNHKCTRHSWQLNALEQYNARKLLENIYDEYQKKDVLSRKLKIHSFFILLLAIIAQAGEHQEHFAIDTSHWEQHVEIFLRKHFQEKISVKKLAKMFHHSESQLFRKFRNHYGFSPMEYLQNIRLEHASYLLNETSLSISEIAYQSGFSDCCYFSNCFRKKYGVSPKKYKAKIY